MVQSAVRGNLGRQVAKAAQEEKQARLDSAATVMQKHQKRREAQLEMKQKRKEHKAAAKVQAIKRGQSARVQAAQMKQEESAATAVHR